MTNELNFATVVATIKSDIQVTQARTVLQVNSNLILLYFRIGKILSENSKYGNSLLWSVSAAIQVEWPGITGFSVRNLKRMRHFYNEYRDEWEYNIDKNQKYDVNSAPVVPHLEHNNEICQHYTMELSWSHNVLLIEKVKDKPTRRLYAEAAIKNGWSRSVLERQIKTEYHKRIGRSTNNFEDTLPASSGNLAKSIFKDPYIFDFLNLKQNYKEADLEHAMLEKLKQVLLELGRGFSFVGSQYKIIVKGENHYIDLLFYHIELKCYVAVELKITDFKSEYAGQLGLYIKAIDENLKRPEDNKTIGLLLCKGKGKASISWVLDVVKVPIGVSSYEIQKYLPTSSELNKRIGKPKL